MIYLLPGIALALWLGFNWLAPLATVSGAQKMSEGRIPAGLLRLARDYRVTFYTSELYRGPGFSAWVWPRHIIVLDAAFLRTLTPEHSRFVIAHELGHVALGHLKIRWLCVVTGLIMLPGIKRRLDIDHESEADTVAERLTGFKREFFDRPDRITT